jgi:hypothetical protein
MAGPHGAEEKEPFVRSLEKVELDRIRGSHLEMPDAAGTLDAIASGAPPAPRR